LPWRRTRDPYCIWVSEILLQQTRVDTVLPYYTRFIAAFPTAARLVAAQLADVLKLWQGLGYYARARHLHDAARIVMEQRGGQLPRSAAEWRELPGIGRYTASAISSIAADEPVPVVDGNVQRVLARLFAIRTAIERSATQAKLWSLAEVLLARKSPGAFNQALMELGARVCAPRRPQCGECPLRRWCAAESMGWQERLPARRAKRPVPTIDAAAALLRRRGQLLLVRRPPTGLLAGMWTLPAVEITDGRSHADALRAWIRASLGVQVSVGPLLATVRHAFSHRHLRVHIYACMLAAGSASPRQSEGIRWVAPAHWADYPLATVDRKIIRSAQP
jgi:A/G-specific adenine glycosylase